MSDQSLRGSRGPFLMMPWFPILEANQGFLSLLALVIAILVAAGEIMRATTQKRGGARRSFGPR